MPLVDRFSPAACLWPPPRRSWFCHRAHLLSSPATLDRESDSSRLAVEMIVVYGISANPAAVIAYRLTLILAGVMCLQKPNRC